MAADAVEITPEKLPPVARALCDVVAFVLGFSDGKTSLDLHFVDGSFEVGWGKVRFTASELAERSDLTPEKVLGLLMERVQRYTS